MDGKNSIFVVMPIVVVLVLIVLIALPFVEARPPRHPEGGRGELGHDAGAPPLTGGRPPDARLAPPGNTPTSPPNPP